MKLTMVETLRGGAGGLHRCVIRSKTIGDEHLWAHDKKSSLVCQEFFAINFHLGVEQSYASHVG